MRIAIVVLASLVLGSSCIDASNPFDPETPADAQARASITGTVRTIDGGTLRGATVTLFQDAALAVAIETGEDGAFSFSELVPGGYSLDIAHPAHLPTARAFLLSPAEATTVDVTLTPIAGSEEGTGHLTGVVQRGAELSRPAAAQNHAGVVVEVDGSGIRTTTNAAGRFDLFLLPGNYTLSFSTTGHAPATRTGIDVVSGETIEIEPVVLDATPGSLAGTVALEGAAPPGDVTVTVTGTGASTSTAADGSFLIGALPAGLHTITLAKAGFITATVGNVLVEAGGTTTIPTTILALARGAVEGTVDLVGRGDDSGVAVSLTGTTFTAVTNDAGRFRIDGVPEGVYELTASRDGFLRGVAPSVTIDDATLASVALQLALRVGDFEINGGAAFTRNAVVTLALDNPDAATFMASEDATFADPDAGDVTFRPIVAGDVDFTLSAGDGEKVVFVLFQDSEGIPSGPFTSSIVLDTTPPAPPLGAPGVLISGGAAFTNATTGVVTVALSAVDATSGVALMQLSTDAVLDEPFQPFATSTVFSLAAGADGARDVFVRFQDLAGNVGDTLRAGIVIDRAPPAIADFTINGGAATTTSPLVELTLTASDALAGVARMALSTSGAFGDEATEPFAPTRAFFLAPGEGSRSAFVKVVDAAGNATDVVSDSITVDATAPSGTAVSINAGAAQTNSTAVTLTLSATAATQMRVCVDGILDTEPVEGFATSRATTLAAGDGNKTVFVVFLDDAGNSSDVASDSILLDTTAPFTPAGEVALRINGGAAFTNDTNGVVTLALVAADATTSVATMQLSTDGILDTEPFVPFATSLVFTLGNAGTDGSKSVLVRFRDVAGNTGASSSAGITLDRQAPTVTTFTVNSNAAFTTSGVVELQVAATDTLSGVSTLALSTSAGFPTEVFEPFGSPRTFVLAPGEGSRSAFVKVKDAAGNVSGVATDAITVDATPPQGASVVINGGAAVTNNPTVSLALSAQGATTMRISLDGVFDTEPSEAFATTKSVTLSGQGSKSVFVVFGDDAGNVGAAANDSITVDTVAPSAPAIAFVTSTPGFIASTSATLTIGGTDAAIMKIRVVEDANCAADPAVVLADFSAITAEAFSPARTLVLPPNAAATNGDPSPSNRCKHAQLLLLDEAGNTSSIVQARIELDALAPDAPRIGPVAAVVDDDNDSVKDFDVPLVVDAVDHNLLRYEIRNGDAAFVPLVANTTDFADPACITGAPLCTVRALLRQSAGARTENRLEIRAVDRAGNVSASDLVIVTEDSDAPQTPRLQFRVSDEEVTLSWDDRPQDQDVEGYLVSYAFRPASGVCPTDPAAYVGSSFASEGVSPIDVGRIREFRLTSLSNNIPVCLGVQAYDGTEVVVGGDAPLLSTFAVTPVGATPNAIGLQQIRSVTTATMGIARAGAEGVFANQIRALGMRNGLLYLAVTGTNGGLVEFDPTDPGCLASTTAADFAGCANVKRGAFVFTDPQDIAIHGDYAFVADGAGGVRIFQIGEGVAPVFRFTLTTTRGALSVAASQNTLVVGERSSGTRAFDGRAELFNLTPLFQATPAIPTIRPVAALQNNATAVFVNGTGTDNDENGILGYHEVDIQGDTMLLGSQLWSIANPDSPTPLAVKAARGNGTAILAGRYIYSTNNDAGLDNDFRVVDIGTGSVTTHPVISEAIGGAAVRMVMAGPYVFVSGGGRLDLYDVSDSANADFVTFYTATAANEVPSPENDFNKRAFFGAVAVDGNRVYFSAGRSTTLEVLELGDVGRLQILSSNDVVSGDEAAMFGANDSWVNGRFNGGDFGFAPEQVVRATGGVPDVRFSTQATNPTSKLVTDGDQVVFIAANNTSYERAQRLANGTISGHTAVNPGIGTIVQARLRWPWLVLAARNGTPNTITVHTVNMNTNSVVSSSTVATSTNNFNIVVALEIAGGFVYAGLTDGVFNASSNIGTFGLYRATIGTGGALGTFVKVENGPVTVVQSRGRRIWWGVNTGGFGSLNPGQIRAQTLTDVATWTAANVRSVVPRYPYEHYVAFTGPHVVIPGDLEGYSVHEVPFDAVTGIPASATPVVAFDLGSDAHTAFVHGDRVYFLQKAAGGFVGQLR